VASFSFALIGLSVIGLFVENRRRQFADRVFVTGHDGLRPTAAGPRFRVLVVAAGMLALFTVSDAFIYIGLQRTGSLALGLFPLLYVGHRVVLLLLALPAGRLADRVGRRKVYLAGQLLMPGVYVVLLAPGPTWVLALALHCSVPTTRAPTESSWRRRPASSTSESAQAVWRY